MRYRVFAFNILVNLRFQTSTGDISSFLSVAKKWASSLTITGLNLILPLFFEVLTELEDFSPRVEVAMKLWRYVSFTLIKLINSKSFRHKMQVVWATFHWKRLQSKDVWYFLKGISICLPYFQHCRYESRAS